MKKLLYLMAMCIMLLTSACSKDEEEYMLSANDLEQTTWKATLTSYENDGKIYKTLYILQFYTKKEGNWVFMENDISSPKAFSYTIDRKIILFNGFLDGKWTIMDANSKKIIIQAYWPEKCVIVLEKQY